MSVIELIESREQSKSDGVFRCFIRGETTASAAIAAMIAEAPTTLDGFPQTGYRINPISETDWQGEVNYSSQPDNSTTEIGTQTESFEITTQTTKITHSIANIRYPGSGAGAAPDIFGAINVNAKGEVEGCEILVPTFAFSINRIVSLASVNSSFKFAMMGLVGKVNNDSFGPFAPGECLFAGLRGSQRDSQACELAYSYLASPNVTGLSFGSISGVDKKGFEYLSVTYDKSEDTTSYAIVPKVRGVYVHQVYPLASFAGLPAPT